ncbi:MAG: GLPGLI family protein [Bacteroidia bacterium]|nr:MAG: GLPGLI family protein [Bacteroidia bacterium]
MKRSFALLATIMTTGLVALFGQSGTIQFEEVRKIEIKLEGEMAHLMENMPKEQRSGKSLYFSPQATIYKESEEKTEDQNMAMEGENGGIRIMMSAPDNKTYIDLEKNRIIEQKEFMTRMFLIEDDIVQEGWKITGNQKMILDYSCMEATQTDTAGAVTRVWFAPSFPAKGGPSNFCSLPGMVMEVDINDGSQIFLARSVDMTAPSKDIFKKPSDGKKVTREEFDTIVEEKMKEMNAGNSAGGTFIIKIKN